MAEKQGIGAAAASVPKKKFPLAASKSAGTSVFRPPKQAAARSNIRQDSAGEVGSVIDLISPEENVSRDVNSNKAVLNTPRRPWIQEIPLTLPPKSPVPNMMPPPRLHVQESNKRRKLSEPIEEHELSSSPPPTQAPPVEALEFPNNPLDVSNPEDDIIVQSGSQSDGIHLSEASGSTPAHDTGRGPIGWASSNEKLGNFVGSNEAGGLTALVSVLRPEEPVVAPEPPAKLFSSWFTGMNTPAGGSSRHLFEDNPANLQHDNQPPQSQQLMGLLERLNAPHTSSQATEPPQPPLSVTMSSQIAPQKQFTTKPAMSASQIAPSSLLKPPQPVLPTHKLSSEPPRPPSSAMSQSAPKFGIHPQTQAKSFAVPSTPAASQKRQQDESLAVEKHAPITQVGTAASQYVPSAADVLDDLPFDAFDFALTPPRPTNPTSRLPAVSLPTPTHAAQPPARSEPPEAKFRRLQVLEKINTGNDLAVIWRCYDESDPEYPEWDVEVKGPWATSNVAVGDYIHAVGKPESQADAQGRTRRFVVDEFRNLLVLQPDLLLTSTGISIKCPRRAVLARTCKSFDSRRAFDAIKGDILHKIIQGAFARGLSFRKESLAALAREQIQAYSSEINLLAMDKNPYDEILPSLSAIEKVATNYFGSSSINAPSLKFNDKPFQVRVTKCLEIEEGIESLLYGLKGSIDVSVEAVVKGPNQPERRLELPLEIKSTYVAAHSRQVISYSLLMADRYDRDIKGGLVMSIGKDQDENMFHGVTVARKPIVEMMIARNRLASYIVHGERPDPAVSKSECEKCSLVEQCALFHKSKLLLANPPIKVPADDKMVSEYLEAQVPHMNHVYARFITNWNRLITLEERYTLRERRLLWSVNPEERERRGICFHNLRVEKLGVHADNIYTFARDSSDPVSWFDSSIHENDSIIVSSGRHIAICRGRVLQINSNSITVRLKSKLIAPPSSEDDPTSQRFPGLYKVDPNLLSPVKPKVKTPYPPVKPPHSSRDIEDIVGPNDPPLIDRGDVFNHLWCIDKDDSLFTYSIARSNILFLFRPKNQVAERLRRLIVDLDAPRFGATSSPIPINSEGRPESGLELNEDQKTVIQSVLSSEDYSLILGMPGTGKTTLMAQLVLELTCRKKSVLISGYTHSAVDNLLIKLKSLNIPFCRLGEDDRVHPDIRTHILSAKSPPELHPSICPVVATTCWGVDRLQVENRIFDYCLVDEASQLTVPACLGPLRFCNKFVLVGDLYQLPPLVLDSDARRGGLVDSLFKKLSEAHPSAVFELHMQYRMNGDIMELSNALVYGGRLRCANLSVRRSKLQLPLGLKSLPSPFKPDQFDWIRKCLEPNLSVAFFDTDAVPAPEDNAGGSATSDSSIRNDVEAQIVAQIVNAALVCGVSATQVGVISPLRAQLRSISRRLPAHASAVEINTVDKYQGRDKDFIIFSLVRSNSAMSIGNLLQDFRRVNVALTRSKSKLLIIGSRSTFEPHHLFAELFELMEAKGWIHQLPKDANKFYKF